MENLKKHRDIKLVRSEARRSSLVSALNYHTTRRFICYRNEQDKDTFE